MSKAVAAPKVGDSLSDQDGATSSELAELCRCTVRHIELLAQKGVMVRLGHGRYDWRLSVGNYVVHLREQAASRAGQDPAADSVGANVKWKEASTELVRLRLQREAGELVGVDDVRETWGRIMRGIRQFVLALPGKVAFEVPTLTAHDRGVIERICRDELQDAALGRGFEVNASVSDDVSDLQPDGGNAGHVAPAAETHAV